MSLKELEAELSDSVNTEVSGVETEEEEEIFNENFGLGNLVNELLKAWAEHVRQGFGKEVEMNEYEIKSVNIATNPILEKLSEKAGVDKDYLMGIVATIGIVIPRIFKIVNESRKVKEEEVTQNADSQK